MRNKLLCSGIIAGIIFCISWICFADEKSELQLKEVLYNEMLQNAQGMIQHAQFKGYYAQTELKNVQDRLKVLERNAQEEAKHPAIRLDTKPGTNYDDVDKEKKK